MFERSPLRANAPTLAARVAPERSRNTPERIITMSTNALRPILIAGPTASGKSQLAVQLAREFGGVVINADSMQVYRELSILTARPAAEDEALVPHRLYGHVPVSEAYSAGRFVREAASELERAKARGERAIIVGGTGLYFKALLEGLAPVPDIAAEVRSYWRSEAERLGAAALHGILSARDPDMAARLKPTDPQRIVRALEVLEGTGRSLAEWQSDPVRPVLNPENTVRLVVREQRSVMFARADARFDQMMAAGALEEARSIGNMSGLAPELPAMRALGLRPLLAHLAGAMSLGVAVAAAKSETRAYIKRQTTWIAKNMIAWNEVQTQHMEPFEREKFQFIDLKP